MTTLEEVYNALKYRIEVDRYGTRRYYNSAGQLHREDGPAVEHLDDTKCWYHNGLRHRIDGPAIVWKSGHTEWWLNGTPYTEQQYLAQL